MVSCQDVLLLVRELDEIFRSIMDIFIYQVVLDLKEFLLFGLLEVVVLDIFYLYIDSVVQKGVEDSGVKVVFFVGFRVFGESFCFVGEFLFVLENVVFLKLFVGFFVFFL